MKQPGRDDIRHYLSGSPKPLTKRELTDAFGIKGDHDRNAFNQTLKAMEKAGELVRQAGAYSLPGSLPGVDVLEVTHVTVDGDVFAKPVKWEADRKSPPPRVEIMPGKKGHPALEKGDRVLARLTRINDQNYRAETIRRLDTPKGRVVGTVVKREGRFFLRPVDKRAKFDFDLPQGGLNGAQESDFAVAEIQPSRGPYNKKVRILDVIGRRADPKIISRITIHEAGLREHFPHDAVAETKNMVVPPSEGREDLRSLPLVTIDGADARDFDDAVWAEKTDDGFHLIVAIADVAYYVRPGSALDEEARARGNSTYFPDCVLPMLPEKLSNDLCSLRPGEDRACMAFHLWINNEGNLKRHQLVRGLMKSAARLTYEQAQAARDGMPDSVTRPLTDNVIGPLYEAFGVLQKARDGRGALELDMPERKVLINEKGEMTGVRAKERLDSHRLIEEFMITANVAAALSLSGRKAPCPYRVHDIPDNAKMDSVREFVAAFGLSLPKGQVTKPGQMNHVLKKAAEMPFGHLISEVMLRAQMQAHYSPDNIGHFGLALTHYAHFTSPIRRYADLLLHRILIKTFGLGAGGAEEYETHAIAETCDHISNTERLSAQAERNAVDRFAAAYLQDHIGAEFAGRIRGLTAAGLFVDLDETGAYGFIPMRLLPYDEGGYIHDELHHVLIGMDSGRKFRLGATVTVTLKQADGVTGGMIFELSGKSREGADIPGISFNDATFNRGQRRKSRHRGRRHKRERDSRDSRRKKNGRRRR